MYDIIILGSGPAGLTAALYTSRASKKTLVLGGHKLGGQTAGIAKLENYPGWAGSGLELSEFMKKQCETFGTEIIFADATKISGNADTGFTILTDDGKEYIGKTVILATGASPRKLEIAGAKEFFGKGVSYCATCDGFFYKDKTVLVIGGGNSALNDALYLSDLAKQVKIVYRKDSFSRVEQVLLDRATEKENIEFVFHTELKSIEAAAEGAEPAFIATTTKDEKLLCDGFFIAIGHEANTDYLSEDIKRDHMGRIIPANLPAGMFVAGDVQSEQKMQIATAVGLGCNVSMDAILFLNSRL
jgi:thioredoxin reductase (NADPH)